MKKNVLFSMMVLAAGSLLAADSNPKDDVKAAATALGNAANYTWHQTVEVPDGGFGAGTTDGKTEKGGYTTLSLNSNDTTSEAAIKGTNAAVKTADNGWQSAAEATANGGGGFNAGGFIVRTAQNLKTPDLQAAQLADAAKELKKDADTISGDMTEDGAKTLLSFRGGRRGGPPPAITNPKGSVKFWLTDGKLVKYSFHLTGSMDFNGNPVDIDRTTTVEIKDVGTTKIEVSDEAKKKLQ